MDKKALNLPILISLVVGNMIGTGIYILPASLAQFGSASLIAWIFTCVGALLLALTLAHLNQRFPKTGGPYVFCKEAFGHYVGFLVAYTYWISNMVSIAGLAVSSVGYLGFVTPLLDANASSYHPLTALFVELAMIWLFTLINIIGIHTAGVVQLLLTIIKITPLILITLIGLTHIHLSNITESVPVHGTYFAAIGSAAALTFWAFIGLESATVPAENTQGSRDIYKATVFGTLLTSIIYIAATFVLMGMIPGEQLKSSQFPFATAGTMLFGAGAALFIAISAVISGLGSLNVCTLVQGQIVFAAARDHLFPQRFTRLSKHDVPIAGQLLSSTLVTVLLILTVQPTLLKQFNNIALLAALLTLITYFATTLAELKFLLRTKQPLYRCLFSKSLLITVLAALYAIWMISNFTFSMLLAAVLLFALSTPIYFFALKK